MIGNYSNKKLIDFMEDYSRLIQVILVAVDFFPVSYLRKSRQQK
jgi:hypothetical protein